MASAFFQELTFFESDEIFCNITKNAYHNNNNNNNLHTTTTTTTTTTCIPQQQQQPAYHSNLQSITQKS